MAAIAPGDGPEQFIPARKSELFAALLADLGLGAGERLLASQFRALLVALIHHRFLADLETLHDAYHLVDPDQPRSSDAVAVEAAHATVTASLEEVLRSANFVEIDPALAARAQSEQGRVRTRLRNDAAQFRAIRLFRRGAHRETLTLTSLFGLRRRQETVEIYDQVVLLAAVKPAGQSVAAARRRRKAPAVPHGAVMIKYFHDIAVADLDALYPGAKVVMSTGDRLSLGVPALVAGIPLAIKLAPAALVLYGVLRIYLGGQPPSAANLGEALVVAGALLALGGFLGNQWTKFQRRALLHQRELNDMIYFHNITNNVGIFDHLTHEAEEQDGKEALLAYFLLLGAGEPLTEAALDARCEGWLGTHFGLTVDFEVDDALSRLAAMGLVVRDGEGLSVLPLSAAVARLDRLWDDLFVPAAPAENG